MSVERLIEMRKWMEGASVTELRVIRLWLEELLPVHRLHPERHDDAGAESAEAGEQ